MEPHTTESATRSHATGSPATRSHATRSHATRSLATGPPATGSPATGLSPIKLPSWSELRTMVQNRLATENGLYGEHSPEVKQLKAAMNGLQYRSFAEILKLLRDSDDFTICFNSGDEDGLPQKIGVEKMVQMLPLHLLAVLISEKEDKFGYVLGGIRLLHTLCEVTSRHAKLEQVLLDDLNLLELMTELVILTMVALGNSRKESWNSDKESLVEATLVASALHLLHGFISPLSEDIVKVLLVHPRVDAFIDGAFGAVHNVVRSLKMKFLAGQTDLYKRLSASSIEEIGVHCLQAEAALQFLHCLCQHKLFNDRLVLNKELCGNGSILMLARSILSLAVPPAFVAAPATIASISRMKAKTLSILHNLFEVEKVSFLDEVVSAGNLELAKTIASEVLKLLRVGFSKASKGVATSSYPAGFVLLNSMRMADVLSDDSNFRPFFTEHFSKVLSAVFCLSHGDFLSMLCSSKLASREDDVTLDYDLHSSAGFALGVSGQSVTPQFKLNLQNNLTMTSYAHQRTALFVKIIANLHCFIPHVCQEQERNRFVQNFMSGLRKDPLSILDHLLPAASYTPVAQRGTGVCKNLCSLLRHAESLIPNALNQEDVLILRAFCDQLQPLVRAEFEESQAQAKGGDLSGRQQRKEPLNLNNEEAVENAEDPIAEDPIAEDPVKGARAKGHANEEMEIAERLKESDAEANILETSGSDTSSNRGKSPADRELGQTPSTRFTGSGSGEAKEDERAETLRGSETQRRKRKRSIMNDEQVGMIEKALADEPDMHRNSAWIHSWAEKLSQLGPEVITSSQLKNWLNNRKAKLARAANKQMGPVRDNNSSGDLEESPGEENSWRQNPSTPLNDQAASSRNPTPMMRPEGVLKPEQLVRLMDERGESMGIGRVYRTEGDWFGLSLETRQVCVVDVFEYAGAYDTWKKMMIPHGSDDFGRTFEEALSRFGKTRVAWDLNKVQCLPQ